MDVDGQPPGRLAGLLRADFHAAFPSRRATATRMVLLAFLEPGWNATVTLRLQLALYARGHVLSARLLRRHNLRRNGMDVQPDVRVGPGLLVRHPVGIVLGQRAELGARCWLGPGVFLGRKVPEHPVAVSGRVGDDVVLGAHCLVLGPVSVGDGARIAAGAVVTHDVPAGGSVAGVPARCRAEGEHDPAAPEAGPGAGPPVRLRRGAWFLLPQAVSRLTSVYVFATVAHRASAGELGALALATAFSGASLAVAPAVVGRPLAALQDPRAQAEAGGPAQSAAVLASVAVGVALEVAALLTHGLVQLALLGGAMGVPAVMVVESTYWRAVFTDGPRTAGLLLSGAYALQAGAVTASAVWLPGRTAVLVPFAGLGVAAVLLLFRTPDLHVDGARAWLARRATWLPYVVGVSASVVLVQAIPVVLSATAGFASASTYRAGELAFGGTNLLIAVATQTLLTSGTSRPWSLYARVSAALVGAALCNAVLIALVPLGVLEALVGPTAPLLRHALPIVAVQRVALAVSSVGTVLLVARLPARSVGRLEVFSAGTSLCLLVAGGLTRGLQGGLAGLATAEVLLALLCARRLRRATGGPGGE